MQAGTQSQVSLEGPLGAGGVQITADGDALSIVNSHGDHLDSDAAHGELAARLGFDPPLSSLRFWIQGVPDPSTPSKEKVDPQQQRLQSLEQDGWQIDYTGYVPNAGGSLPSRLTLQRSGVRVRLIVDGWTS
jgi:outer membrane lipoprotein LolB